jgi:membrane protease YdiL (CAAX protease family)
VRDTTRTPVLARVLLWSGVMLFWIVQLTLLLVAELPVVDTILLAVLLAVVPMFSLAQLPLMEGIVIERLPAYWGSIASLWLLGGAAWLVGTRGEGMAEIGITGLAPGAMIAWTLGLTLAGFVTILVFRWLAAAMGVGDTPLLRELLPRTARERRVFALLSVAAGFGEELAYRGYAITALTPLLGVGGAATLSSVVFGVVHGYQGTLGMVRTGIMGGVLAWGFLASGSLWPAIAAHVLIDVLAGIVLGERLLTRGERAHVDEGPELRSVEGSWK